MSERFRSERTHDVLTELADECELLVAEDRRAFVTRDGEVRVAVPAVQPIADDVTTVDDFLDRLEEPDQVLLLLIQAGASALGFWECDELIRHKVIKKYVTRGKGRAQPTHLKTKGKSRYGSRLRLQNWKSQLVDTSEKLHEWIDELGPPDVAFYASPVRVWPEFWTCRPAPPLGRDAFRKVRTHVHVPDFKELQRVYEWLHTGWIEC